MNAKPMSRNAIGISPRLKPAAVASGTATKNIIRTRGSRGAIILEPGFSREFGARWPRFPFPQFRIPDAIPRGVPGSVEPRRAHRLASRMHDRSMRHERGWQEEALESPGARRRPGRYHVSWSLG